MIFTRSQVWGTLKRYLMYTTAGFIVLGGMGAAWSHRAAVVAGATAADLFNGTKLADQFVQSASLATPSWAHRVAADLNAQQAEGIAPTQHQATPMLVAVRKPDASDEQFIADTDLTGTDVAAIARPVLSPSKDDLAQLPTSLRMVAVYRDLTQSPTPDAHASAHSPFTARMFATAAFKAPDISIPPYTNPTPITLAAAYFETREQLSSPEFPWSTADVSMDNSSIAEEVARDIEKVVEVRPGDTLYGVLVDAGVTEDEAKDAVGALSDVFSPRALRAGQEITLNIMNAANESDAAVDPQLISLTFEPDVATDVTLKRNDSGDFIAASVDKELVDANKRVAGMIDSSLFGATQAAGVPMPVTANLIKIFSFDVDFQRDIQDGDAFELVYERKETADGDFVKSGQILFASLTLSGRNIPVYYFERDGDGEYYSPKGEAIRKSLLRTPVDGARITSGFGMRMHPVLGYSKMHKGLDFGAPSGTPIFAAGAGTVVEIGKKGAYGNYIRIRHNGQYQTSYAHMSKFAKGIGKGDKVKQGDVIGYVGATGRVTGPHLHYEILVDGAQINPTKVKMASGDKLTGKQLKAFQSQMAKIDAERARQNDQQLIAERPGNADMSCGIEEGCQN